MRTDYLGIDIGSTNVKLCRRSDGRAEEHAILAHEGNVADTVATLLDGLGIEDGGRGRIVSLATGTEGRHRLAMPEVIAPVAIESALEALGLNPRAVVSMGGEDLVVYIIDDRGRISSTYAGNKCASGTGEFFKQQLGRMDLALEDLEGAARDATVCSLSARCSVFMKSDCTHRLNKGESTVGDIALSLSKVMADKVSDFLTKARVDNGQVVLIGGVTRNRFLREFLAQTWPGIDFVVPDQSPYFEAFGAALLAEQSGGGLPSRAKMLRSTNKLSFGAFPPHDDLTDKVRYVPSMRGAYDPEAEYILGVDGGSTTTKIALVNAETLEIAAEHYGRTHGDPVSALKRCVREVMTQLDGAGPRITMVSATGSSRELLGVFLETPAVYNEIIAHTVGTTYFEPAVDTLFEIGGQDAKYVSINNSVPIDYAMNEACSAGTGSFLEESSRGDLSIDSAPEIGPIALEARAPLKFGEHCSAFINSDIRKAIQQGAAREDIVAGLVFSVVSNYLNRVVGNRFIGEHIVLQGGVAKNPAVPLAFARLTGKSITVPPDPELMGCFGVALMAVQKHAAGLLAKGSFDLAEIAERQIATRGTFTCKSCENRCSIRKLEVGGRRYPFGGRCSKFTNKRKRRKIDSDRVTDYTLVRSRMLFEDFAPNPDDFVQRTDRVVGVPMAFSVHSLWPFYSWFFHTLGVRIVPSTSVAAEGIAKLESNYCFPAEIAHGAIQDILDQGVDYLFLPFFRDMPSMEQDPVHACVCPLTQGLPFFARQAFHLETSRILKPMVSFKHGWDSSRRHFEQLAADLGLSSRDGGAAYDRGIAEYRRFLEAYRAKGRQILGEIEGDPEMVYVALLGRPYNAFTADANMGIPRKFVSQGVSVVPFDMIFEPEAEIYPNMYWYYGQQDMKAIRRVAEIPNLYPTWITNFSCAPDSFMLHYLRWMMGAKPYLVLEIDSHSADAGIDTRVEAFLDIVESYRRADLDARVERTERRYELAFKGEFLDVIDHETGDRFDIRDPRVKLVFPSMGDLATEIAAAAAAKTGITTLHLPVPNEQTAQLARTVASGKECIPALLVLGLILQFLQKHPPNQEGEVLLFFVPSTLGPCRTGQYHVFYDKLLQELGFENVRILVGDSSNSYREMGSTFTRELWWALVLGDYFTDARTGLRLMARDVDQAMRIFDRAWHRVVRATGDDGDIDRALEAAGRDLAAIPRRRSLEDIPRVLVVGEIYVRRDTFSVGEITDFLVEKDIFPKVTGITEWVGYTDYARKSNMDREQRRRGIIGSLRSGLLKDLAWYHVEDFYKNMVEHKVARHLVPTGLIPPYPHDMGQIIDNANAHFIDRELESEATVSSGVAATAMTDGYSGVAIIAPFACLPGRLIEGVYAPWARQRGYPVIALENDGQPYPPNVVARMEIFAHNVTRFREGNGGQKRTIADPHR
jgi:predicted CoA-substrate-specific enzyme activase